MKHTFARSVVLAAALLAAACASDNNKIGSTVKGTRIAVVEQARTLEADKNLKNVKPSLPPMVVNLSWPQAGYDSEHQLPYSELAAVPQIVWETGIGEGSDSDFKMLARPVIDNGTAYTMDAQGLVRAIDAKSGDVKWERDTTADNSNEKAIAGGLAVDGGSLYATTGFGDVLAIDAKNGNVKWRKALHNPLRAAPTVADNRVYVVSIDNDFNALDAGTGDVLWHQTGLAESATLMGAANPAVEGDNVIVAYDSGDIFDLRAQNGRSLWNYSLASPAQGGALPAIADIRGLPVVDHGRVYAVSHNGRTAVIDQRSGDRIWEAEVGGIDTPVVAGNTVFLYGGESQLIALDRESGRAMWTQSLPRHEDADDKNSDSVVWTGPVLAGERLWMVNSKGQLASFSPMDGAPVDTIDIGHPVYLPPIIAGRTLYIAADDGTLVALR